jgi:hypothetical protein
MDLRAATVHENSIFVLKQQDAFRHQIVILIDRISRPLPDLQN